MFIPRALSPAAETSIATSSHSLNSSSSSSGFTRSSEFSAGQTTLTSASHSTTSSHPATSTSFASAGTSESASETDSSSPKVTSSSTATSGSLSSGSSKASNSTTPTMTTQSATELQSSTSVKESSSSDGRGASPTIRKFKASSTLTSSVSKAKQSVPSTSSGALSTHTGVTGSSSQDHATSTTLAATRPNIGPTLTTDHPLSTFSTPVTVTLTHSSNGEKATTVPPLITSISTSIGSDGSTIGFTHVVANPTGSFSNNSGVSQSSFFHKPGQVIGTFLGLGIILAALIGCAICLLLRRRRRRRNAHTSSIVSWSPVADHSVSFLHLPEAPPMRTISTDVRKKPSVMWGPRPHSPSSEGPSRPMPAYTPNEPHGMGLAGIERGGIPLNKDLSPFDDLYGMSERVESTAGLAITTGQEMVRLRPPSFAPSSPSLYSESTKSVNDDADSLYEQEMGISTPRAPEYRPLAPSISSGLTPTSSMQLPITSKSVVDEGPNMPQFKE